MEILFLEPIFKERIWGGQKLRQVFNYPIEDKPIGECWAISGHHHGASKVLNGRYQGMMLSDLYQTHKEKLFNHDPSETFPLLIKILDADDDLSIQVHPDDVYAMAHENDYGKTECWYVIDADDDAIIIDGHNALTKQEFVEKIKQNDLSLWKKRKIKKDDFIYIPAKKVHAIGKGSLIYEVQQSSDTTYRIYDYDRIDSNGLKRDLHLKKALDVIDFPSKDVEVDISIKKDESYDIYRLIKNEYFELRRIDIKKTFVLSTHNYQLCSVLDGNGFVDKYEIKKGDHFIIPGQNDKKNIVFKGQMRLMITQRPS